MSNISINVCSNPSSNNVTEGFWKLSSLRINGQLTASFVFIFMVVGLPWNIMVVITAIKKKLYHQPTIMLLLNLVVSDILTILIYYPFVIVTGFGGEYIVGSTDMIRCRTCKFALFMAIVIFMDSLFIIALISFDRFLFIYKPLHYELEANKRRTLVCIASTTVLSIAIGLISLIIPGTVNNAEMFCLVNIKIYQYWYIILIIIFSCIAITVITVCNIWVIYIVQKNIKEVYKIRRSFNSKEKRKSPLQGLSEKVKEERNKRQLHLYRVFGGLLLSNSTAWFPLMLVYVLAILKVNFSLWFFTISDILFLSQVAVHPILETTLIADIREPLKDMITCNLLKNEKNAHGKNRKQTHSYCLCCQSAEVYDDNHCSCCSMLMLIDAAVLPKDNSSRTTASIHDSGEGTD